MFETCIQMIFQAQCQNYLEMSMINMRIYSKKSFENCFYHWKEIFRKWYTLIKTINYLIDKEIALNYWTGFLPMSLKVQYTKEQALLVEFLHFAHQPIDIKIFGLHSW